MKAVLQRVLAAKVEVAGREIGRIGNGLVVLLGVAIGDAERDADYLAEKTVNLRIFDDQEGKMNRSLLEVGGEILVVSQFTLLASCRKGRRPNYINAAPPAQAIPLYERYLAALRGFGVKVESGEFQAEMLVHIQNHGPVTIILDSRESRRGNIRA